MRGLATELSLSPRRPSPWRTPTAAPTAPSTRSAPSSGCAGCPGLHCYDLFAGESRLAAFLDEQPGTYLLTDFLVRSFDRTVVRELGLDRHPELRDDYFRHYTRVVWLAQEPDDDLRALAEGPPARSACRSPSSRPATVGSRRRSRSCWPAAGN